MLRRFHRWSLWAASLLIAATIAGPPTASALSDDPWWVAPHRPAVLWSGPDGQAESLGVIAVGTPLQVTAPQRGERLPIWNPMTRETAWIDAPTVGPIEAPTAPELQDLAQFEPWWAMTHTPVLAWPGDRWDDGPWGEVPMWRYFSVLSPPYEGRVLALEPQRGLPLYVDIAALGPVGPPPPEYFRGPPADGDSVGLPARVVRDTDWYTRPDQANYFARERLSHNQPLLAEALVDGLDGESWYRVGPEEYVPETHVRLPKPPERTFPGRWIDADLSEPVLLTAYEDDQPIYAALAVKGTIAFITPTGVFRVWRRVQNETMDSETLGIPRDAKDGYYLKDVLFTQYFTGDGAALHYNYWRSNWGYAGSHGCLGLNYDDALFFWEFATAGTPVYVHN